MAKKPAAPAPAPAPPPDNGPITLDSPLATKVQKRRRVDGAAHELHPHKLGVRDRQDMALALRKRGATFQDIANQLKYASHSAAAKAVKAALDRIPNPDAAETRKLYNERYEEKLMLVDAAAGNPAHPNHALALGTWMRIMAALTALNGVQLQPDPNEQQGVGLAVTVNVDNSTRPGVQKLDDGDRRSIVDIIVARRARRVGSGDLSEHVAPEVPSLGALGGEVFAQARVTSVEPADEEEDDE